MTFPIGQPVRMSPLGLSRFGKKSGQVSTTGIVIQPEPGITMHKGCIRIHVDGRKKPDTYHEDFWEVAE